MRALYISAWFPYPPDNGARLRAYHLMKALAQRHEVHLISMMQDDSDPADADHLSDICSIVSLHPSHWFRPGTLRSALGFLSSAPRSVVDTFDKGIGRAVRNAVRSLKPDIIIASSLGAAPYVPHDMGVPTLLDEHNCEYAVLKRDAALMPSGPRRLWHNLSWRKSARWEAAVCRAFDCVTIVSDCDRALLLQASPGLDAVYVVPNGVDTTHYSPGNRRPAPGELVYNGALTYWANLDAVRYFREDIYPILKKSIPNAILNVTGRTSGVELAPIADCPGIRLTGYVDDIRTVLERSEICIVPLRYGGGSRLKILEAMAAGIPVVTTTVGAEGLDIINEKHAAIADTPLEFAGAVARVLGDKTYANRLSRNARRLVEECYDWNIVGPKFVEIAAEDVRRAMGDGIIS